MVMALLGILRRVFSDNQRPAIIVLPRSTKFKPDIEVLAPNLSQYKPGSKIARGPDEVKAKFLELIPQGKAIVVQRVFHTHQSSPHYYKKTDGNVYVWNQGSDFWGKVKFEQYASLQVDYFKERGSNSYKLFFANSWIGN